MIIFALNKTFYSVDPSPSLLSTLPVSSASTTTRTGLSNLDSLAVVYKTQCPVDPILFSHIQPSTPRRPTWPPRPENVGRRPVRRSRIFRARLVLASADRNTSVPSPASVPARSRASRLAFRNHRGKREFRPSIRRRRSMLIDGIRSGGGSS